MNRHAEPRYTCGWPSRRMTPENERDWIAMVSHAEPTLSSFPDIVDDVPDDLIGALLDQKAEIEAEMATDGWYAEYLAENARRDADDRQGDFYDGDGPDFD
jgi:hypothetical protein